MINSSDFSNRIKKVLDYYNLSASQFAEKIHVQRSSISHLLSGRNKPSLDFVLKVLEHFEDVEFYWLLKGKGTFPKSQKTLAYPTSLFSENTKDVESNYTTVDDAINTNNILGSQSSDIAKIVIFYKDGTFKQYIEN